MEFIMCIIVIVALLICLGFSSATIITGTVVLIGILLALFLILMLVMFTYSMFRLITSKKHEADFSKIDKNAKGKMNVAYYIINGKEYPNAFPYEKMMSKKLYNKDKKYTVYLNSNSGQTYDKYSFMTILLGMLFSVILTATVLCLLLSAL